MFASKGSAADGACNVKVDPYTHTITCAGSQFCLRVTLPIQN